VGILYSRPLWRPTLDFPKVQRVLGLTIGQWEEGEGKEGRRKKFMQILAVTALEEALVGPLCQDENLYLGITFFGTFCH
jgi:hypothetical protein